MQQLKCTVCCLSLFPHYYIVLNPSSSVVDFRCKTRLTSFLVFICIKRVLITINLTKPKGQHFFNSHFLKTKEQTIHATFFIVVELTVSAVFRRKPVQITLSKYNCFQMKLGLWLEDDHAVRSRILCSFLSITRSRQDKRDWKYCCFCPLPEIYYVIS